MKFVQCLSALILSVGVMAEDVDGTWSSIFDGRYSDSNHPQGFNVVAVRSALNPATGYHYGLCMGSETSMT